MSIAQNIKPDKKQKQEEPSWLEIPWFQKDEHKPIRSCKCFCGQTFQSQARSIEYLDRIESIDKHGLPERTKEGQPVYLKRVVKGVLSYEACPKCGANRIASFS